MSTSKKQELAYFRWKVSIIVLVTILLYSCGGDYKRIQKSGDNQAKFNAAVAFYKSGNYLKALPLFEELITAYRGSDREQDVYYYYAYTNYKVSDFVMAGYYFSSYYHTYPHSTHTEECEFMYAYCEYMLSPIYSLDQSDTKKSIEAFQTFVDNYPKSDRVKEANRFIDLCRSKLEKKYFEIAKQYYTIEYYHSASVALNNYMKTYPESKYNEEAQFLVIKSNYLYAVNSVKKQRYKRFQDVITCYHKFVDTYPKSEYLGDAEKIYSNSQEILKQPH